MTTPLRRSARIAARNAPPSIPVPVELRNDAANMIKWFKRKQESLEFFMREYNSRAAAATNDEARFRAELVALQYSTLAETNATGLDALRRAYDAPSITDYDQAMAEYEATKRNDFTTMNSIRRGIQGWAEVEPDHATRFAPRKSMSRTADLPDR